MQQSFKHEDVFPVIHRLITDRTSKSSEFVSHSELVDALLADAQGATLVAAAEPNSKLGSRGIAANMVAWFSQQFPTGRLQGASLLERRRTDSWAYRNLHAKPETMSPVTVDVDEGAMEGNPYLRAHVGRERNAGLAKAKLESVRALTGRLACECCGFDASRSFPGLESPLVEVHHRTPLWKYNESMKVGLADLAVLCPTCHRAIHRHGVPSVEEFKEKYFPPK